jgi:hypothetical protein
MRKAIVFLDWDSARRVAPGPRTPIPDVGRAARQIDDVFAALRPIVASKLTEIDPDKIFRVRWRLYHGWYSGLTKTTDLLAVERFLEDVSTTTINRVSFGADIVVASSLLCGGPRILYDTLRQLTEPDGQKVTRQKMVDTALVCDLAQSARSAKSDVHIIVGDDDDLLPGLFMAQAWGLKVHMFRRGEGSRHLKAANLVTDITAQRGRV